MTTDVALRASAVDWAKAGKLARNAALAALLAAAVAYYLNGGTDAFLLSAEGHVARDRVTVAPAFEGRVVDVFVRPGDRVEKGQKIALVQSVSLTRTLAEIAVEKARLTGQVAELTARQTAGADTLPEAENFQQDTAAYLKRMRKANANGFVTGRAMSEVAGAALNAAERVSRLKAEREATDEQLKASQSALAAVSATYQKLTEAYQEGALYAPAAGYIGDELATPGQSLTIGGSVATIYSGENYVLTYLPDGYLFEVSEGQNVKVKVQGATLPARIERILPEYASLPAEFQNPNRTPHRGRLARVVLLDKSDLSVNQKVRITSCLLSDCAPPKTGALHAAERKPLPASLLDAELDVTLTGHIRPRAPPPKRDGP